MVQLDKNLVIGKRMVQIWQVSQLDPPLTTFKYIYPFEWKCILFRRLHE